jgi:hypothetical protein
MCHNRRRDVPKFLKMTSSQLAMSKKASRRKNNH